MNEEEARAFHGMYIKSFIAFVAIATVSHVLVWNWRPWF